MYLKCDRLPEREVRRAIMQINLRVMKVTFVTGWGMDWKDTKPEDPWRQWQWSRGEWPGQVRWQRRWRDGEALETGYSAQFLGT